MVCSMVGRRMIAEISLEYGELFYLREILLKGGTINSGSRGYVTYCNKVIAIVEYGYIGRIFP